MCVCVCVCVRASVCVHVINPFQLNAADDAAQPIHASAALSTTPIVVRRMSSAAAADPPGRIQPHCHSSGIMSGDGVAFDPTASWSMTSLSGNIYAPECRQPHMDFVYHSTLGLSVIKKKEKLRKHPRVTTHLTTSDCVTKHLTSIFNYLLLSCLELSDTNVNGPQIRFRLGTAAYFCALPHFIWSAQIEETKINSPGVF